MSGSAGGNRIPRSAVEKTVQEYIDKVLSKVPGFKSAKVSGSYNTSAKEDFGDIDLITTFEGEDKKEFKKQLAKYLESLPDDVIVPFKSEKYKGKKTMNTGEIVTILYPIVGMPGEFVQVDNIIALTEEEGDFKKTFLDYPAEIQGLILGLVKVVTLEEDPNKVLAKMGIKNIPTLEPNQEYEFNLSSAGLTLRIVTLDQDYKQLDRTEVWKSSNWADVKKLLSDYNIDQSFKDLVSDLKKLKNPRSKNRIKGIFKSMVSIKSGEVNTPKGDNKQMALDTVASLEEKYGSFITNLIRPILEAEIGKQTIAVFPGAFKPPHASHLKAIQVIAPKVNKVYVYVSKQPRVKEGQIPVDASQAMAVWDLYKQKGLIPGNVEIKLAQNATPVLDAYQEFEAHPENKYLAVFGKDQEDRWRSVEKNREKYSNVTPVNIGNLKGLSASDLRTAIAKNDIARIKDFIPFGVSPAEYLDALNMPVKEPISEGKSIKKLRVFDFDDTLAHIKALIRITHQDGSKEELTPAEYAVYNPQPGDKFNFSDFNKVIRQAHPIKNNVQDLIRSYNDPTEKTTILTARMLGYPVKKYLRDEFGIEPYVVGLGSADPMDKARWIEQQIHKGYNDIEFRDDSKKNVDAVATLQDKYPDVKLTSMLVESYKGKKTNNGAPGTFKAKITKAYGGDVTIEKAKKYKSRENATPLDKQQANWFINFHSKNESITPAELKQADAFADAQLAPIDVDLTSKHVFDRLTGRDSDISFAQLIGFFKRLGRNKKEFFEFFKEYDEIVANDKTTNLNIPFLNMTNKAIAKTIMRKPNFMTSNPKMSFEENLNEVGEANLKPYKWEEVDMNGWVTYTEFTTESGTEYKVDLTTTNYIDNDLDNSKALEIEFLAKPKGAEGSSTKIVVNKGEMYRVMSTITAIIKHYVKKFKAKAIMYSPTKKSDEEDFGTQRDNLYKAFISKALPGVKFEKNSNFITAILPSVKEVSDPQAGTALPYGSGFAPVKESYQFKISDKNYDNEDNSLITVEYKFSTPDNTYRVEFYSGEYSPESKTFDVSFGLDKGYGSKLDTFQMTGENNALNILKTIVNIIIDFTNKFEVNKLVINPTSEKRGKVYSMILKSLPSNILNKIELIQETVTATEVICDKCGWTWKIADGGDDLYICHNTLPGGGVCGHDNNPDLEEGTYGYDTDVKTNKKLYTPGGLKEAKQVGTIYHFTTFANGFKILEANQLKSFETDNWTKSKPIYGVSFTRDKRFHNKHNVGFDVSSFGQRPQVRFTVDGDKLSNSYKIQPYAQIGGAGRFEKQHEEFEAEERVVANKPFTIPILNYLKSIDILVEYKKPRKDLSGEYDFDEEYNHRNFAPIRAEVLKFAQDNNIPINLTVNKNGDPWPAKEQATFIDKILNFFKKEVKPADLEETSEQTEGLYTTSFTFEPPIQKELEPLIEELTNYMVKQGLNITPAPEVQYVEDEDNAKNTLGRTAYYDPNNKLIVLYITGRHPKDILRSFAHEMIHHMQNLEGRLENMSGTTNVNEDDYLADIESEAYNNGNMIFRSWENDREGNNSIRNMTGFAPGSYDMQPINEGAYDSITRTVVKDIMAAWKEEYNGQEDTLSYDEEYETQDAKGRPLDFILSADLLVKETEEGIYKVDGGADAEAQDKNDEDDSDFAYLEIRFQVDPRSLPQFWSRIYQDLIDVVRHEIEHLTQMGVNLVPAKETPDDEMLRQMIDWELLPKADYFRLQTELDPMLQGMYLKAKKTRTPFKDVLNDYLDMQDITPEDKENILGLWRKRLKALSLPQF